MITAEEARNNYKTSFDVIMEEIHFKISAVSKTETFYNYIVPLHLTKDSTTIPGVIASLENNGFEVLSRYNQQMGRYILTIKW